MHQLQWIHLTSGGDAEKNLKAGIILRYCACREAWETSAQFADAFKLGAAESAASLNLIKFVPQNIRERLTTLVRTAAVELLME